MVDYSLYDRFSYLNINDDLTFMGAVRLAINEFLLNGIATTEGDKMVISIKLMNETLGKFYIPLDSSYSTVIRLVRTYILGELYKELPEYCICGHKLCSTLENYKDDLFLTKWTHICWRESSMIQGFILGNYVTSIYLLMYDSLFEKIKLYKAMTGTRKEFIKDYEFSNDPTILARQMIFDIYENGFEDVSNIPELDYLIDV